MLTAARIREDLQGVDGLRWITTLRAPTIRKLVNAGAVTPSFFDERDLAEITSEEFPGERLIVCRNPLLAAERQRKRQELLAATEKDLKPIVAATRRQNQPLCGASTIGLRVGKVINRHKMAKHFVTDITDDTFPPERGEDRSRGTARRDLHRPLQRRAGEVRRGADGPRLQGPVEGGAGLSQPQVGRPEGAGAPPPASGLGARPRPAVHAGLLRRVAHAPSPGAAAVRRPRPGRRRAPARFRRRPRTPLSPRPAANAPTTTCRCTASGPCSPTWERSPSTRCRSPETAAPSLCRRNRRRCSSAASSYWGSRRTCSHYRHHAEGRNRLNKNDFYAIRPRNFGIIDARRSMREVCCRGSQPRARRRGW